MASIDLSAIANDMRGKIGNIIVQRWKDILYVRKFTQPRESNTEAQIRQRAYLSTLLPLWRSLNSEEKRTWNDAARDLPMSGYNLFLSTNMHRQRESSAPLRVHSGDVTTIGTL